MDMERGETEEGSQLSPAEAGRTVLDRLERMLDPDGTLRVPRLVVVGDDDEDAIVLQRARGRSEVVVHMMNPPGGASTDLSLFAYDGHPDEPDIEPSLGAVVTIAGNSAASVEAVPDRWGRWELNVVTEDPTEVNVRSR
jgi:hypothetical protein